MLFTVTVLYIYTYLHYVQTSKLGNLLPWWTPSVDPNAFLELLDFATRLQLSGTLECFSPLILVQYKCSNRASLCPTSGFLLQTFCTLYPCFRRRFFAKEWSSSRSHKCELYGHSPRVAAIYSWKNDQSLCELTFSNRKSRLHCFSGLNSGTLTSKSEPDS